ncbi:MAG: cytochrome c [Deltaproteobacteria bacterium]|nr:cytochrome c [Deltaproteobacteria bacterium]
MRIVGAIAVSLKGRLPRVGLSRSRTSCPSRDHHVLSVRARGCPFFARFARACPAILLCSSVAFAAEPSKGPTKEALEKGKAVFTTNCAACHGETGAGDGPAGLVLNPRPRNFAKDPFKQGTKPEQVFKTITEGVPGTVMVGWPQLPEEDRWALAHYVRELLPKSGGKKPAK